MTTNADFSEWLADPESGPWHLINRLSAVSELDGQSMEDFTHWIRRMAEVTNIVGAEA